MSFECKVADKDHSNSIDLGLHCSSMCQYFKTCSVNIKVYQLCLRCLSIFESLEYKQKAKSGDSDHSVSIESSDLDLHC